MELLELLNSLFKTPVHIILTMYPCLILAMIFANEFMSHSNTIKFRAVVARKYMDRTYSYWMGVPLLVATGMGIYFGYDKTMLIIAVAAMIAESRIKRDILYWYTFSMGFPEGVERNFGEG